MSSLRILYRNFIIDLTDPCPPIPSRAHDWCWTHQDYDGPEDNRIGTCASIEEAKEAVDEWWEDQEP